MYDQKFSLNLDDIYNFKPPAKMSNADISIIVEYDDFLGIHDAKEFGYKTRQKSDGKLDWLNVPRN